MLMLRKTAKKQFEVQFFLLSTININAGLVY